MDLPIDPPVSPMLARLVRDLPRDGYLYEPKWDGFRCLAFRSGEEVVLQSRNRRPLERYFPELVEALGRLSAARFVLDGEVVLVRDGVFDFESLLGRLHPSVSRVERLRRERPASFVGFDLLADGDADLRAAPFERRRTTLEGLLRDAAPPLFLTPATAEAATAERWLERFQGHGIDGVVAKHRELPYREGKRAMVKVKRERTADCVVAGLRVLLDRDALASLLLGLYDGAGILRHVGVVASFPEEQRRSFLEELRPLAVPLAEHPWRHGFLTEGGAVGRLAGSAGRWTPDMAHDWMPLAPERVCEVAYDQVDRGRFRHAARFRRWRPDRDAGSCSLDQLRAEVPDLREVLSGS